MKRLSAYPVYLFISGADGMISSAIFTVNMVYQATVVGLNPLQLVLVGTTWEATAFIFEIPTGIVADVYSRRLSVVVGYLLIGVGFLVEGSFPFFATVLIAQVIWGIGYTFTSGALQAWLSDEIGESFAGRAFLRGSQIAQLTTLAGIAVSVYFGVVRVNLPILIGGGAYIALGVLLAVGMPERGFIPRPREERNSFAAIWRTWRDGLDMVRRRPTLATILGVGVFYGIYSEGVDRLWTPYLLTLRFPGLTGLSSVAWFGLIRAGAVVLGIAAIEFARRRINLDDESSIRRAMFAISGLLVAGLVAFSASSSFWMAVAAYWAVSLLRQAASPLYTAWVNQRLESSVRATVISMSSQVDAFGQIAGGPVVGLIGTVVSLRAALAASATLLAPVLVLFARAARVETATVAVTEEQS